MQKTNKKKQNIIVIIAAIAIVVISSFATYYTSEILNFNGASQDQGYQNVTFTDATLTCERETKAVYGKSISTLTVDNHSSRYDERQFLYKIFMEMDLHKSDGEDDGKLHFVNCFVRSSNGTIKKYDVFEADLESPAKADDGTNLFGMPKRK